MQSEKQYQCRHIFTDGRRCQSPCLRQEEFCYYHHTTRKPVANARARRSRRSSFHLPLPEDRSAIQSSIGEVLQRIAANDIDPRRAGLLLYGLQIASLNLPKQVAKPEPETVDEITTHPELGILAPRAEVGHPTRRKSTIAQLLEKMLQDEQPATTIDQPATEPAINGVPTEPAILPTIQATEADPLHPKPEPAIAAGVPRRSEGVGSGRTAVQSHLWSGERIYQIQPWRATFKEAIPMFLEDEEARGLEVSSRKKSGDIVGLQLLNLALQKPAIRNFSLKLRNRVDSKELS